MIVVNDQSGYINRKGEIVIAPQFDAGSDFSEGMAAVSSGDKWGYIDTKGRFIVSPKFDFANAFSEGFAAVLLDDKYDYVDKKGKLSISFIQYDQAGGFCEGMVAVEVKGRVGHINHSGGDVIPNQFEHAGCFSEWLAPVRLRTYSTNQRI